MTYITRTQSGLPGPTDGHSVPGPEKTKFVVHWDGGENPDNASQEIALLRAYARHHINQGWQGPAYNLAVGPITGNVYEYRGLSAVGTHAPGANRDGIGCILIGGVGNLTEAGKRGLREAYALANSFAGRQLQQLVHSDVVATACPGPEIRAWVHSGGLKGGSTPTPAPSPKPTTSEEDDMAYIANVKNGNFYCITGTKAHKLGAASNARKSGMPIIDYVDDWAVTQLKTVVSGIGNH